MPWIRTLKVLPGLWIAWGETDHHQMIHARIGITADHAWRRTARAFDRSDR
jgi:hypothetical protein